MNAPRSATELFMVFTRLALQGFGGVLAVAQRTLVEQEGWLTKEQFLEMLSVSQVLPGPNIINLALIIGDRFFGWRGAAAAVGGLLTAPLCIVLTLAILYRQYSHLPAVAGALRGMGSVAAGLILATAVKLGGALKKNAMGVAWSAAFLCATVLAVGVLRWPMAVAVLGLGPVAMTVAYRVLKR